MSSSIHGPINEPSAACLYSLPLKTFCFKAYVLTYLLTWNSVIVYNKLTFGLQLNSRRTSLELLIKPRDSHGTDGGTEWTTTTFTFTLTLLLCILDVIPLMFSFSVGLAYYTLCNTTASNSNDK